MKLIGITQRIECVEGYNEIREQLDMKWGELLIECGYMPITLTKSIDVEIFLDHVPLQGFILTGGNDLFSLSNQYINKTRDLFEKKIIEVSIQRGIPILGVCRGMQVIGEFFGAPILEVENHIGIRHDINIMPNTILHEYIKKEQLDVNSYHKYSIKDIDENVFNILATSKDGEIEAIMHRSYSIMAQMWHPEREEPFKEWDKAIIQGLFL